ncbi:Uncharacterised protein [Mycobacteroides abscessus subsp. abscessus]|nr:Uncharacterised protein [Mycobacteroides abscessus subsp. abscessus]
MATVLVDMPTPTFPPSGWSPQAQRKPLAVGYSFFIAANADASQRHITARGALDFSAAAERRRSKEKRALILDAVLTALGVKARRYPQTLEERLERALNNIASDRAGASH